MTAEVAIANAGAVALAADSAVTIGGQKIYNSALKLFALSKVAPVGIMIYGNAGLMNVPWETLIKSYRKDLGDQCFSSLVEYASGFIEYLNKHPSAFPEESQTDWLKGNTIGYFKLIRQEFLDEIHPILKAKGEIEANTVTEIFSRVVKEHHEVLSKEEYADDMSDDTFKIIREKYKSLFKELRREIFEEVKISAAIAAKLNDIATFLHVKQVFSTGVSGLVVAGYGEAELYPSIATYEIEGVIENQLKYRKNLDKCHKINAGMECRIIAFAQEDMVTTFMNGINPTVLELLHGYLTQLFERLPELLDKDKTDSGERKKFTEKSSKLLMGFFEELSNHIQGEHAHPVLRMVTVLPKDELAAMAEALVNLTAFKRRITESMETVGGPIDVVVISKGDGLVWVKRKHYFPPELNQHFFKNYFRGITHDKQK